MAALRAAMPCPVRPCRGASRFAVLHLNLAIIKRHTDPDKARAASVDNCPPFIP